MNCPNCTANMEKGKTVLTFQMGEEEIVVVRDVPAMICDQCGEEYVDSDTAKQVEEKVERALADGIKMGFIDFNTAA
nr:type II toxin-antitoxin system MqsA family antitoxin [Rhodohalobacter halophilus]